MNKSITSIPQIVTYCGNLLKGLIVLLVLVSCTEDLITPLDDSLSQVVDLSVQERFVDWEKDSKLILIKKDVPTVHVMVDGVEVDQDIEYDILTNEGMSHLKYLLTETRRVVGDTSFNHFKEHVRILYDFTPLKAQYVRTSWREEWNRDKKGVLIIPSNKIDLRTFIHEYGHYFIESHNILSHHKMYEDNKHKWVGQYGYTNPDEYFAESYVMYHLEPLYLLDLDVETYNYIKTVITNYNN